MTTTTETTAAPQLKQPVVFFDGYCGLCDRTVNFLLRRDRDKRLLFSPLQGETFESIRQKHPELENVNSVILAEPDEANDENVTWHVRSEATLRAIRYLPAPWKWAGIFRFVPRFLRDAVYKVIAKNRLKIWGERETCRLPTPEERDRFLP